MNKLIVERIKTCLIAILVLSGLVQIGILRINQNQGVPYNLLSIFLPRVSGAAASGTLSEKDILMPYRVVLSQGDSTYWMISKGNTFYNNIWEDTKTSLKEVLPQKPQDILAKTDWAENPERSLIDNRAYIIQFKEAIPVSLLSTIIGGKTSQAAPAKILKILVTPGSDTSADENNVYLFDGSSIYKYTIKARNDGFNSESCNTMIKTITDDGGRNYQEYSANKEFGKTYNADPDVLYMTRSTKREYRQLSVSLPQKLDAMDTVPNTLLGNDLGSFLVSRGDTFILANNTEDYYKIYNTGLLDYRSLVNDQSTNKGSIKDAFAKSVTFINKGLRLVQGTHAKIILTKIDEEQSSFYRFIFNYRVDDFPVYMDIYPEKSGKRITNAIVIEANGQRVLNCKWQLLYFEPGRESRRFDCIINKLIPDSMDEIPIKDMGLGYIVKYAPEKKENLWPAWMIEKKDGAYIDQALPAAKGD